MLQDAGKDPEEIIFCFDAVVKNNDRAIACIVEDIRQAFLFCNAVVVIAAQHRPEDKPEMFFQDEIFPGCEAAIWRTEKVRSEIIVAVEHIIRIFSRQRPPAIEMVKGMVADGMAFINDCPEDLRVLVDIFTDAEKGCFCI